MAIPLQAGAIGSALLAQGDSTFWMPSQLSEHASRVDWIFYYVYYISLFFFLLIVGLMVLFVMRYRRRSAGQEALAAPSHNTSLEVLWTVVPVILVATMFFFGFQGYMDLTQAPLNAYNIDVNGQKWKWQFTYPTGYVDEDLHVPVDRPIQLTMTSSDVIHSLFIPDLRIKRDVVPGRYTKIWFTTKVPGDYPLLCAQYCGTGHSVMGARLIVHPRGEFEQWLTNASNFLATLPPAEAGQRLYQLRGCKQCHSLDGAAGIGPTFKNLFGHEATLRSGGTVAADENYIRESILEPQAKIVAGFDPVMPRVRLSDAEIDALIVFLRTQSDAGGTVPVEAPGTQPTATQPAPVAP
jgi:cytochrome c oxidase subunit 2